MNEWEVLGVIVFVFGFVASVVKPLVSLTKSITKLTTVVERLDRSIEEQKKQSIDSHTKLWKHNGEQDDQLADHEKRIYVLEQLNK